MNTLTKAFIGFFILAVVLAVACNSDSTPGVTDGASPRYGQQSDCPACVLRSQIESAQPGETINIPAGIYTLTDGELLIDKNLTLAGAGAEETIIQAASSLDLATHRVIHITEHSIVFISGVTIRYGNEDSTEPRMIPFHSEAVGMPHSGIENIRAEFGGGIYNQGTLTLTDSIITENYAGGGAGLFNGAKLVIENSTIIRNLTLGFGAGIFNGGILIMSNTLVEDNTAGSGSGFSNWGEASVVATPFRGNHAQISGGGFNNNSIGVMTLDSSTVSYNNAPIAGGFRNWGNLTVTNSTVSDNTANLGAGIENRGILALNNTTVSSNTAREGGGLVVRYIVPNPGTTLTNTILAGNTAPKAPDCTGTVHSAGHNLLGNDDACGFIPVESDTYGTANQPIDPRLGDLALGEGLTATKALLSDSPAIDAAASGSCPALDQRGVARPRGASCDIGAYER